ncbi:MAG: outer membrane beta-barrel protein [Candidatus Aminicenantes bacterium]|nr:outer membrane beta-barrel protein [Candidatus Aminicenantes bacterium]
MNKMKIMTRNISLRISVCIFLVLLFFGRPSNLFSEPLKLPVSISFSFGYFQPKEKAFKDLYGNNKFQLSFSLRYVLMKNVSIYSGLRYLACNGETKIVGPEFQEEKYDLKFTMYSIPLALIYSHSFKNINPFLGGGISYNIYREKWDQLAISFEDKNLGLFLIAGAEYFISKRFSLLGRAQFSSIPTKQGSELDENVNLGGTEYSLGLSFYF